MPVKGKTKYWLAAYEEIKAQGHTKAYSAEVASIIEERHRAKLKRKRK